jgi:hypothetical protein
MDRVQNTGTVDRPAEASAGAIYESPSTIEQRNRGELIKANSAVDTQVLVNSGKLPVVQIDSGSEQLAEKAKSSSEQNSCDTTYTHADWQADKLALSKALDKANEALTNKDIQAFKEFFGDPHLSPEVRQEFIKRNGDIKIQQAFGEDSTYYKRSEEHQDALEFAYYGRVTVPTMIERQNGFWGLSDSGVENALKSMSAEEQGKYQRGKQLASDWNSVSVDERETVNYFYEIYGSLKTASGYSMWGQKSADMEQVARWESLIRPQPVRESEPVDVCERQKTAIKASQKYMFEEQEQLDLREREREKQIEIYKQNLLESIPEAVNAAAAKGNRYVQVLGLERAFIYDHSYQPGFNSDSDTKEDILQAPQRAELNQFEQQVYDRIASEGFKPSIELMRSYSNRLGYMEDDGYSKWVIVARW